MTNSIFNMKAGSILIALLILVQANSRGQIKLKDVEEILRKDSNTYTYINHRPSIETAQIGKTRPTPISSILGKHMVKSAFINFDVFVINKNRKDRNKNMLFIYKKQDYYISSYNIYSLYYRGSITFVDCVAGIGIKDDRLEDYSFFVKISGVGKTDIPTYYEEFDPLDTLYQHPRRLLSMNMHSIFDNNVEAIYLFDSDYRLKAVFDVIGDDKLQITSFDKVVKKGSQTIDRQYLRNFGITEMIQ